MKVKDINIFEQHIEKIVLAVAAAGALYMGYLAIQPVNIDGEDLAVDQTDQKIAENIARLKTTEESNAKLEVKPVLADNVTKYKNLIQDQPLSQALTSVARVPTFGPGNVPLRATGPINTGLETYKLVAPAPIAPEMVTADAWQQPVADVPPPSAGTPPIVPQPGQPPLPTRDQNAVVVQGYIPVGKMLVEMASQKDNLKRIPNQLQRAVVSRIEVQRRERISGGWSDWTDVQPSKAGITMPEIDLKAMQDAGADAGNIMDQADSLFKQIVIPDFYYDAQGVPIQGPNITKAPSKQVLDRLKQLQDDLTKATTAAPTGALPFRTGEETPPAGAGAGAAVTADVTAIKSQALVPFVFWDDAVETGHTYQYRLRIRMVNPVFNFPYGVADAAAKAQPTLDSSWFVVPNPVAVSSDVEFFVTSTSNMPGAKGLPRVNVRAFKRTGGKWYVGDWDVGPGVGIAGQIALVDQPGEKRIDVDTGYTLVDVNDTRAVLVDGTGNMSTRDANIDRNDPKNAKLFSIVAKHPVATTAPATPTPTPGTIPPVMVPSVVGPRPGGRLPGE
jgi:hypothetical protein